MPSGKTTAIIRRFPDFFDATHVENLFYKVVDAAGQGVETAEVDLMRVLRAHHVVTANNLDSQGLTAQKKGDLDKLFSLYLEALGGTSQLLRVSPTVQTGNLKAISAFVNQLASAAPKTLDEYLWQQVQAKPTEYGILPLYAVGAARLTPQSLVVESQNQAANFLEVLATRQDGVTQFLRQKYLSQATQTRLANWLTDFRLTEAKADIDSNSESNSGTDSEITALVQAVLADLQGTNLKLLRDPGLFRALSHQQQQRQLQAALVGQQTLAEQMAQDQPFDQEKQLRLVALCQQLRQRLPVELGRALRGWGDRVLTVATWQQVAVALQGVLSQPLLVQRLLSLLTGPVPTVSLPAPDLWVFEQQQVYPTLVKTAQQVLLALLPPGPAIDAQVLNTQVLTALTQEHATARGDDLIRLNRRLLALAYPGLIQRPQPPQKISTTINPANETLLAHIRPISPVMVKQALAGVCNQVMAHAPSLYTWFRSEFDALELGLEAETLIAQQAQQPLSHPDQIRLNRLLLEAAYPLYLERSEVPYRERLQNLIKVLRRGAASQEGIVQIVAANLGMPIEREHPIKPWETEIFSLTSADLSNTIKDQTRLAAAGTQTVATKGLASLLKHYRPPLALRQIFSDKGHPLSMDAFITHDSRANIHTLTDRTQGEIYRIHPVETGYQVYRQLIRVLDYSPTSLTLPTPNAHNIIQPTTAVNAAENLSDTYTLSIDNPNPDLVIPLIRVKLLKPAEQVEETGSNSGAAPHILPLSYFELVHVESQTSVHMSEKLALRPGETVHFFPDGRTSVGLAADPAQPQETGLPIRLPPGQSTWQVRNCKVGLPTATFEKQDENIQTAFDFCMFPMEQSQSQKDLEIAQAANYQLKIDFSLTQLTLGTFVLRVPWHIPGYTDKFDDTTDHPRHQISGLINKVKAAGIQFSVNYEYFLTERHDINEKLHFTTFHLGEHHDLNARLNLAPTFRETAHLEAADQLTAMTVQLQAEHDLAETRLAINTSLAENHDISEHDLTFNSFDNPPADVHDISDYLLTNIVFDHTRFDAQFFEE